MNYFKIFGNLISYFLVILRWSLMLKTSSYSLKPWDIMNLFRMISHLNKVFCLYSIQNVWVFSHNIVNTWCQENMNYVYFLLTSKVLVENTSSGMKLTTKQTLHFQVMLYRIGITRNIRRINVVCNWFKMKHYNK